MPSISVKLSGPFFSKGDQIGKEAVEESIKDLVIEGEREVKLDLTKGHGLDTGHYRNSINGVITNSMHGVIDDSGVVYGPWLESGLSNKSTRFKGYNIFRKAGQKLERMADEILERVVKRVLQRYD